ncbi:MAG: DUF4384 domain-containing protein [Hyphomicrobiaceae bacterium]
MDISGAQQPLRGFPAWMRRLVPGLCGAILAGGLGHAAVAQTAPSPAGAAPSATLTPGASEVAPATTPAASVAPDEPPKPRPLIAPTEARAAKAFSVLEKHCARCHQAGKLDRVAPSANFGNILRLDDLARLPSLVRPGNPDGSRLYTQVVRGLMPVDAGEEGGAAPTPDEVAALRDWIVNLPPPTAHCPGRTPVTGRQIGEAITATLEQAGTAAASLRFVSLAHLYNACHDDADMVGWRQAVRAIFNGLSWREALISVEPIDPARTILKVDLRELGWVAGHWERILQSGANPMLRALALPEATVAKLETKVPVVRGDWLADTVMKAPLYYELMGLPELGTEVAKILQIDAESLRRTTKAVRGAIRPSEFSDAGRMIERLTAPKSTLWLGYTAARRPGVREPADPVPPLVLPPHDAALALFTLPNGLPGFYVTNPRSQRLDRVPAAAHRPSSGPAKGVQAALGCVSCHAGGPVLPVRATSAVAGIGSLVAADRERIATAQQRVGLFPGMTMDGVAPVAALARQFGLPLDARRATAELETDESGLQVVAHAQDSDASRLARRLLQADVPRAQFERAVPQLLAALGAKALQPDAEGAIYPEARDDEPAAVLEVVTDKPSYAVGDSVVVSVTTNVDCHLTLVSIDARGRGTVIFPSDFEHSNLLVAGRALRVPGEGAPYRFRAREPGRETVVANCSPSALPVDGMKHDFERQRFTDLGNYGSFLTQALQRQQAAAKPSAPRGAQRHGRTAMKASAGTANRAVSPEEIARTAITFEVR